MSRDAPLIVFAVIVIGFVGSFFAMALDWPLRELWGAVFIMTGACFLVILLFGLIFSIIAIIVGLISLCDGGE